MTKIEALKMALDGHKVRLDHWEKEWFLKYEDGQFIDDESVSLNINLEDDYGWELWQEPKPKKLVELKCYIMGDNYYAFTWEEEENKKEIPYTIKDGKIFVEMED